MILSSNYSFIYYLSKYVFTPLPLPFIHSFCQNLMFIILNCKRIRVAGGARGENTALTVSGVVKVRGGMSRAHMVHVSPQWERISSVCVYLPYRLLYNQMIRTIILAFNAHR